MPCYHPMTAFRSTEKTLSGKRKVTFSRKLASTPLLPYQLLLPCGSCIGCRLEKSRQWAIRCTHEASLHEQNSFITLTYDNRHLPKDGALQKKHFQDFMKRLRNYSEAKIRYFHCGEYGENFGRPHYHSILFGYDFPDKVLHKEERGNRLYTSEFLSDTWGKGHCLIGGVTFESCAYVARYITKKVTGEKAEAHYAVICEETGEITQRQPEYTTMSRRPGIARDWFEKYLTDVYPGDFVVLRDKKLKPPKYYDRLYELTSPEEHEALKKRREKNGRKNSENNTCERLQVREQIQFEKFKLLKRGFENAN